LSRIKQHQSRQKRQMRSLFSQRLISASIETISCRRLSVSILSMAEATIHFIHHMLPIVASYLYARPQPFPKKMIPKKN